MLTLLLAAGCGASEDLAAEIAGSERSAQYTVGDLNDYLATTDPDNSARASRQTAADWLSRWVFYNAVELELADRGVLISNEHESVAVADLTIADPEFVPGAAGGDVLIRQQAILLATVQWAEQQVPAPAVTDAVAGLRYLCSRHILVETQQEANQLLALIAADVDFAVLAAQFSLDTGSGSLGGELGCAPEGSFVAPFEEAGYSTAPGELALAETQFGFHVIEVISSGPATAENHPQLDEQTLAQLAANAQQAAQQAAQTEVQSERQQLLSDLQQTVFTNYASRVKIDERYGFWDPADFAVALAPLR